DDTGIPDARLIFFDNVAVFDHVKQRLYLVANIFTFDEGASIDEANARLDRAVEKLRNASIDLLAFPTEPPPVEMRSNFERAEFEKRVAEAKEEIAAGEIYQIVLSQRWETDYPTSEALTLYRALRSVNPSPYMFLLRTAECTLVGASPEMLVRVEGDVAETRPIAGTRWRGPYGGAVAYFGFSGNLDSCITIRTFVLARDRAYVQAGGGIVYDSDPAYEYNESVNKAAALRQAISLAKAMLSQPRNAPAGSRTYEATRRP